MFSIPPQKYVQLVLINTNNLAYVIHNTD